jgi:hypothetical protein
MSLATSKKLKKERSRTTDMLIFKICKRIQSGEKLKDIDLSDLNDKQKKMIEKFYNENRIDTGFNL